MRLLLRGAVPSSDHACAALAEWLTAHPNIKTVGIYSPLPGEIDLGAATRDHSEIHWVYPKVGADGVSMTFHTGGKLTAGAFGILEPAHGAAEVAVGHIDAFVCPGLAFDERGGRLGRGRGFYDRLLAKARPGVPKIGICHGFQMVDETFSEPHDIPMDVVLF